MAESNETLSLQEFQLHDKDTGSADVQVALLTRRIEHLTEHLRSKTKADRYKKLIDKLKLRK